MKTKKFILGLILISVSLLFISCSKVGYKDIYTGNYSNVSSDAQEVKIDVETKKADYFYIVFLQTEAHELLGLDTIYKIESDGGAGKKTVKCSWLEVTIADDMKSMNLKFDKNESIFDRRVKIRLDNDKNKEMVFIVFDQTGSNKNK